MYAADPEIRLPKKIDFTAVWTPESDATAWELILGLAYCRFLY